VVSEMLHLATEKVQRVSTCSYLRFESPLDNVHGNSRKSQIGQLTIRQEADVMATPSCFNGYLQFGVKRNMSFKRQHVKSIGYVTQRWLEEMGLFVLHT